jgi:hypothetical protein
MRGERTCICVAQKRDASRGSPRSPFDSPSLHFRVRSGQALAGKSGLLGMTSLSELVVVDLNPITVRILKIAERNMYFVSLRGHIGGPSDEVHLFVGSNAIPNVLAVFERIGDAAKLHDLVIKVGAFLQVTNIAGNVIKLR